MKLSHYTNEYGLIGIARSQSLRATEFIALNDKTELVYAMRALWEQALEQTLRRIPADLRKTTERMDHARIGLSSLIEMLKRTLQEGDGYGSLYVASFARGQTDDHDERGILSLWSRYGSYEGYCLQFEFEDVRRILSHEGTRHSYAWIELSEVFYGLDRGSCQFKKLAEQMSLRLLKQLFLETKDIRFTCGLEKIQPDTSFLRELVSFCGKHKDPAFEDEREMRIFALPVEATEGRIFTGLATPKDIYRPRNGARYIILGGSAFPGLIPARILVGPKATLPDWKLAGLYPPPPVIEKSDIPLR